MSAAIDLDLRGFGSCDYPRHIAVEQVLVSLMLSVTHHAQYLQAGPALRQGSQCHHPGPCA